LDRRHGTHIASRKGEDLTQGSTTVCIGALGPGVGNLFERIDSSKGRRPFFDFRSELYNAFNHASLPRSTPPRSLIPQVEVSAWSG
jgi:hypothetical protein